MGLRIATWNLARRKKNLRAVWDYLWNDLAVQIAFLQELVPDSIPSEFFVVHSRLSENMPWGSTIISKLPISEILVEQHLPGTFACAKLSSKYISGDIA